MIATRNRIVLVDPGTGMPGHFRLCEFENGDGLAAVHPSTIWALERIRADLNASEAAAMTEIGIYITDGVRTQKDLETLAERLGWTDEGGLVSRTSKHLVTMGAHGVDFKARARHGRGNLVMSELGAVARRYFDFVEDDYSDGHVHGDNRDGCRAWRHRG